MSETDTNTNIGQLKQQVIGLEQGHREIRNEFHLLDQKMDVGFAEISKKLDSKTTPHWQAYTLIISVLLAVGGALYFPIRESATKHENQIEAIRSILVPRVEHERHWRDVIDRERTVDDRIRRLWEEGHKNARDHAYLQGQLNPLPKH